MLQILQQNAAVNMMMFPYWYSPIIIPFGFNDEIKRIDKHGIYVVETNQVSLNAGTSVDYGIKESVYNQLPCECVILLKIKQAVPATGASLPVTVSGSQPATDSQGSNITGKDIEVDTERLAYLNKSKGVLRFMEYTAATA